jgi:hypothetical protein
MVLVEGLRWSKKRFTREWIRSRQTFARHRPVVAKKKRISASRRVSFFFFGATSELMGSWMGQRYGNIRPRFSELNRGWPQKSSAKALYRPRIFLTAPAKGRLEYFGGR